jgi:hypothetical protein
MGRCMEMIGTQVALEATGLTACIGLGSSAYELRIEPRRFCANPRSAGVWTASPAGHAEETMPSGNFS